MYSKWRDHRRHALRQRVAVDLRVFGYFASNNRHSKFFVKFIDRLIRLGASLPTGNMRIASLMH